MFVIGHLLSLHDSGAFSEAALAKGEYGMTAMLPDLLSCHDWGYARSWHLAGAGLQSELVLAHMIGDAVVHYGPRWRGCGRKSGWAYLRMGVVTRRFGEFNRTAYQNGWRPSPEPQDSRRGWAHTLVEYSLDQWLADRRDLDELHRRVRCSAMATSSDLSWVNDLVEQHVITPSKPIESQPYRYCGALTRSQQPDEMHLRGLALKFQLSEKPECLDWLRDWLRGIWQVLGEAELHSVYCQIAEVCADPARFAYPIALSGDCDRHLARWPAPPPKPEGDQE